MSEDRRMHVSRGAAALTIAGVLAAGAGGTYLLMRKREVSPVHVSQGGSSAPAASPATAPLTTPTSAGQPSLPDVVVALTPEAVGRAGIVVTQAVARGVPEQLRLPGIIEPNAYRQVAITPLAGGRVVNVSAQLGDHVRRGQVIAQVYSPEVAEARTKYVSAKAMLDAHDRELRRTEKLVEIGAASRQELERLHAEHAAQTAEVESARSTLRLLGAAGDDKTGAAPDAGATIEVRAPIDGVVTERVANAGLNVDATTRLFTVVDLSNVWIIADVFEKDLSSVRVGERATVTTQAAPETSLGGRVSYIDPQLDVTTRTAKVRVEVANPRGELKLGMYADVLVAASAAGVIVSVPKGAVQNVSERQVVYLPMPEEPAKFLEREVRIGRTSDDLVEILSGVAAGDQVVSKGSFFLRAEVERLGLRAAAVPTDQVQTAKVTVTESGYEPASLKLRPGVPARITFVRTTDKTCGTEVSFPALQITRPLPLNQPVTIELTPSSGAITFTCGMKMLRGTVVVGG